MNTRILLLLSLISTLLLPARAQSRLSVGLTAAPVLNYGHSNLTVNVPGGSGQFTPTTFDYRSSVGGFTAGLSVRYALTPSWSLSTALWFTQLRTTQPFPFAPGNVPSRVISSSYQIPLLLNYRLTNRRLAPYFSVGALAALRGATRYKSVDRSGSIDARIKFGGPVTVQAVVGAGVAYRLTSHWSLTAQPVLIWRFQPKQTDFVRYNQFVYYQLQGQLQLLYSL